MLLKSCFKTRNGHHLSQAKSTTTKMPPVLTIVICGPSGSGKSTLLRKLRAESLGDFVYTVSHTTRKRRPGEYELDYHFVDRDTMLQMIKNDDFIEYTEFSGNLYGTSKRAFKDALAKNKTVIIEVDIEGVRAMKKLYQSERDLFQPKFIFVMPPSKQLLIERLSKRKTETADELKKRLARADEEMRIAKTRQLHFDLILVNDDIERSYKELKEFLRVSKKNCV